MKKSLKFIRKNSFQYEPATDLLIPGNVFLTIFKGIVPNAIPSYSDKKNTNFAVLDVIEEADNAQGYEIVRCIAIPHTTLVEKLQNVEKGVFLEITYVGNFRTKKGDQTYHKYEIWEMGTEGEDDQEGESNGIMEWDADDEQDRIISSMEDDADTEESIADRLG